MLACHGRQSSAAGAEGQTLTAGGDAGGVDVAAQWTLPPSLVQLLATDAARNDLNADSLKEALTTTVTNSITTMCQAPGISAGVSIASAANHAQCHIQPWLHHRGLEGRVLIYPLGVTLLAAFITAAGRMDTGPAHTFG